MVRLLDLVCRVAPSSANVLISGETGTGKGLVAQALHAGSRRSALPLLTLNAGYCSEALFARECFGYVHGSRAGLRIAHKGAFELADGGALFLDEVANVPFAEQGRLLRAIEKGEFARRGDPATRRANVRVISATNANLQHEVALGRFRPDLLLRLNPVEIRVPALRERLEDLPELAQHFLAEHCDAHHRKGLTGFDRGAMQALLEHEWPGNVRELDDSIGSAVRIARANIITADDLKLRTWKEQSPRLEDMKLVEAERLLIKRALVRFDDQSVRAAGALGLSHRAFQRRRRRLGV